MTLLRVLMGLLNSHHFLMKAFSLISFSYCICQFKGEILCKAFIHMPSEFSNECTTKNCYMDKNDAETLIEINRDVEKFLDYPY